MVYFLKELARFRLEATDMNINRSALTADVVIGLPNVRDFLYKERLRLMEERRLRMAYVNQIEE